jgi:dolichol-phosphate mannosyltransferase
VAPPCTCEGGRALVTSTVAGDVLVFLPTYNEANNLPPLVRDLRRLYPDAHLLVMDDNSPDGTGQIADDLARQHPDHVRVIHRPGKLGLGSAHVLGMDYAVEHAYRTLVTMDCDYTHRPEDVGALLQAVTERSLEFVIGSRYHHPEGIADWPWTRRAITRTAHLLTRSLLGIRYDATNAFRAYSVAALRRVDYHSIRSNGYSFMFEMVHCCVRAGLKIEEVPVQMPIRQAGESKISRVEVARAILALARLSVARVTSRRHATECPPTADGR